MKSTIKTHFHWMRRKTQQILTQTIEHAIKNQELWQNISLSTQNPNLKPKPNQSKHPLKKTPKFIGLSKKKILLLSMALWPSTTNHPHKKPTTADRNLTILNPHHDTTTNTTKEKTQTLQYWSTAKPTNHHSPTPQHCCKDHEREKGETLTPIHTKIHTSSRTLWLIDRRVGLRFWGNENQIGRRYLLVSGFREKSEIRDERPSLWWCWLKFTMEEHGGSTPFRSVRLQREESDFQWGELMVEEA